MELRDQDDVDRNAVTIGCRDERRDAALADVAARHARHDWPFDGTPERIARHPH